MQFEKGYIYHIYNQGNNRKKIFFNKENYLYFLRKIKTYITPYADIMAWCLMPNHFHLMVYVRETDISLGVSQRHTETKTTETKTRTLNASIGIMLMSYTKAFNKQNNRTGKLFREQTKAECINCSNGITPSFVVWQGITQSNIYEREYPHICFHYIHQNPVKAGLVKQITDWEYSSARDYAELRQGKLVNKKLVKVFDIEI